MLIKPLNTRKSVTSIDLRENKMKMAYEFLKTNYTIRINRFNPDQKEIISRVKRYTFPPTLNEINLHFFEENGITAKSILKDLLDSPNFMTVYDPVHEYFDSLEYKGVSHIDLLLSCLTPKLTDGMKIEKLITRMVYIIKKWLVASVACSYDNIPNHVAIGFISEIEGLGKSRLARFLTPPHLSDMLQESSEKENLFDFEKAFAFNFMVLFDECVLMNNRNAEIFKNKITSESCYVKYRGMFTPTEVPRMANAVFTSNNKTGKYKGFLTDSLGYRRFGCIHLEKMNLELFDRIDINQIWAEAFTLFKTGTYKYMWDNSDFDEFKEFNKKYALVTTGIKVIQDYFEIPQTRVEGELMTASQIIDYLKDLNGKLKLTADQKKGITSEEIGKALSSLGFIQKRTKTGRFYHISKKYENSQN